MTETMLSGIEWQCAVNRGLMAFGHGDYYGQKGPMLNEQERDAGYEAHAAGIDPLTFVERVVAARKAKDASVVESCAVEGVAEYAEQIV